MLLHSNSGRFPSPSDIQPGDSFKESSFSLDGRSRRWANSNRPEHILAYQKTFRSYVVDKDRKFVLGEALVRNQGTLSQPDTTSDISSASAFSSHTFGVLEPGILRRVPEVEACFLKNPLKQYFTSLAD
ncbi:hypothetical protein Tco_1485145 [Tanacetum coccineum]